MSRGAGTNPPLPRGRNTPPDTPEDGTTTLQKASSSPTLKKRRVSNGSSDMPLEGLIATRCGSLPTVAVSPTAVPEAGAENETEEMDVDDELPPVPPGSDDIDIDVYADTMQGDPAPTPPDDDMGEGEADAPSLNQPAATTPSVAPPVVYAPTNGSLPYALGSVAVPAANGPSAPTCAPTSGRDVYVVVKTIKAHFKSGVFMVDWLGVALSQISEAKSGKEWFQKFVHANTGGVSLVLAAMEYHVNDIGVLEVAAQLLCSLMHFNGKRQIKVIAKVAKKGGSKLVLNTLVLHKTLSRCLFQANCAIVSSLIGSDPKVSSISRISGGVGTLLAILKAPATPADVLIPTLSCLCSLGNKCFVTLHSLIKKGVIAALADVCQKAVYQKAQSPVMVKYLTKLVCYVAKVDEARGVCVREGILPSMFALLNQPGLPTEVQLCALDVIRCLAKDPEGARQFESIGGVSALVASIIEASSEKRGADLLEVVNYLYAFHDISEVPICHEQETKVTGAAVARPVMPSDATWSSAAGCEPPQGGGGGGGSGGYEYRPSSSFSQTAYVNTLLAPSAVAPAGDTPPPSASSGATVGTAGSGERAVDASVFSPEMLTGRDDAWNIGGPFGGGAPDGADVDVDDGCVGDEAIVVHHVRPFGARQSPSCASVMDESPREVEEAYSPPPNLVTSLLRHDLMRLTKPENVMGHCVYDDIVRDVEEPQPLFGKIEIGGKKAHEAATTPQLRFSSQFESGNLKRAIRVYDTEYDLVLNADLATAFHTQWFYFRVENMVPGVAYKFNIINLEKATSLFNDGQRPVVFSEKEFTKSGTGWRRGGFNIAYLRNPYKRRAPLPADVERAEAAGKPGAEARDVVGSGPAYNSGDEVDEAADTAPKKPRRSSTDSPSDSSLGGPDDDAQPRGQPTAPATASTAKKKLDSRAQGSYYTLTFSVMGSHPNDTCYLAHSYPYTYSDLQSYLRHLPVKYPQLSNYTRKQVRRGCTTSHTAGQVTTRTHHHVFAGVVQKHGRQRHPPPHNHNPETRRRHRGSRRRDCGAEGLLPQRPRASRRDVCVVDPQGTARHAHGPVQPGSKVPPRPPGVQGHPDAEPGRRCQRQPPLRPQRARPQPRVDDAVSASVAPHLPLQKPDPACEEHGGAQRVAVHRLPRAQQAQGLLHLRLQRNAQRRGGDTLPCAREGAAPACAEGHTLVCTGEHVVQGAALEGKHRQGGCVEAARCQAELHCRSLPDGKRLPSCRCRRRAAAAGTLQHAALPGHWRRLLQDVASLCWQREGHGFHPLPGGSRAPAGAVVEQHDGRHRCECRRRHGAGRRPCGCRRCLLRTRRCLPQTRRLPDTAGIGPGRPRDSCAARRHPWPCGCGTRQRHCLPGAVEDRQRRGCRARPWEACGRHRRPASSR